MAKKSIWNQISNPREEYTDGYGVSRPVHEPGYITVSRKIYNGIDKLLNGPDKINGVPVNKGAGSLELLFDPAGVVGKVDDVAKLSKNLQQIVKKHNSFSDKPARIMWMGPTTGKTTYAKKDLNIVDIDPLTKETRKEVAKKLGLDFRDPKVSESPEYQQAIVDMVNDWLKDPTNNGKTLVASTKHLLDPKFGISFANEPFMPDFETFVARNKARGFRETPDQLRVWYDNILKLQPNIKIDNRYVSEILNIK